MRLKHLVTGLALAALAAGTVCAAPLAPATQAGRAVVAQLEVDKLLTGGDPVKLLGYLKNRTNSAKHRAASLNAIFAAKTQPLNDDDRKTLSDALLDVEPAVRTQAVRLVGRFNEVELGRQVLELAANDRDQWVRLTALVAVRPWTRLTHLYFLEGALASKSDLVRAEAVTSIALLSSREVEPRLIARIAKMSDPSNPPAVRRASLHAMKSWGMLDWETLRQVIADQEAGETLRIDAIELSDTVAEAVNLRTPTLIDIVTRESSINLAWYAFRRLKNTARNDRVFVQGLAKLLAGTPLYNTATSDMAIFLKNVGVRSVYRDGGWEVGTVR